MNKMSAIIFILNKLNFGPVTTKGLAEELDVSIKSIQRYIKEIETAEFPLYNPSKGTYSFVEGFSLEKFKLSDTEAGLLVLLNSFVDSLNNKKLYDSFDIFKKRILNEDIENTFFVKFQKGTKYELNNITKIIEQAISNKQIISLKYLNNKKIIFNLKPLKIVNFEGFWYLICLGSKDKILKFTISKIENINITNKQFEYTTNINKILKEATNVWFELERNIEVILSIEKEIAYYFKSKQYFPLQKIVEEKEDGSLIVNCKISKFEEIIPTIFHWLPYIKVISPKELDTEIRSIIKKY